MRKIKLTPTAVRELDNILFFLEKKWSIKVKQEFILEFD